MGDGRAVTGKSVKEKGGVLYGSVYGKTYREVKEKMQFALISPSKLTSAQTTSEITFAELLKQWQETNEVRLKGGTKTKYANIIDAHIIPCIDQLKLSELTTPVINSFLTDRLQRGRLDGTGGLSASYVRSMSLIISSALKYAVNEDLCKPLKNQINKLSIVLFRHNTLFFYPPAKTVNHQRHIFVFPPISMRIRYNGSTANQPCQKNGRATGQFRQTKYYAAGFPRKAQEKVLKSCDLRTFYAFRGTLRQPVR